MKRKFYLKLIHIAIIVSVRASVSDFLPYARLNLWSDQTRMKVNSFQDRENWPSIDQELAKYYQVLAKHWPKIDQVLINYWQVSTDKAKQ